MRNLIRPQQSEWWLNPIAIICLFHIPVALASALTPESSYQVLWKVPKYFMGDALLLSLLTSVCLLIGCGIGMRGVGARLNQVGQELGPSQIKMLGWMFRVAIGFAIVGYLTFAAAAYARGASIGLFLDMLKGQNGASTVIKRGYFQTLPGITTFTQFGIPAAILAVLVARFKGWKGLRLSLCVLLVFSLLRAVFLSERLALIEVALPGAVVYLRLFSVEISSKAWRRKVLRFAPLAAPVLLYLFFAISESFRSWSFYSTYSAGSLWEFAFGRLSGYYLTSMNNAAYLLQAYHYHSIFPSFTFDWLLKFPGVGTFIAGDKNAIEDRGIYYENLLTVGLNPEFNNPGGMFCPLIDYGIAGGLAFWLATGLLLGKIYNLFRQGTLAGLFFYPLSVLSLMEVPRLLYWTGGRAFPAIIYLIATLFIVRDAATRDAPRKKSAAASMADAPKSPIMI